MSVLFDWLEARGLAALHDVLQAQQVDLDVLPDLTENDLIGLGIALGPRRRLLRAVREHEAAKAAPMSRPVVERTVEAAERRLLSVLFVDLVGSTALSARHDPEETRQIVRNYQNAVAGEVTRFGGFVARFLGDGILAYFGWPRTHEDEAERATRAALAAVASVGELRLADGAPLAARAAIASGLVVVGDLVGGGVAQEAAVIGDTPNIAARLQNLAEPGQVVIADSTRRLLGDSFELEALGELTLKGIDTPLAAFRVVRERDRASRFDSRSGRTLRPMIGRQREIERLLEAWRQSCEGQGRCAALIGEAGIGKSRIVRDLLDRLAGPQHFILRYQCSPYYPNSALWPMIQQINAVAGIAGDDPPSLRLDKLEAVLALSGAPIDQAAPLIANMLGIPFEERYGRLDLSPQVLRARTLDLLTEQMQALSQRRPCLVVVEDVHWADPSSLEFLQLILRRFGDWRVLMVVTARPEGMPALDASAELERLLLTRLAPLEVERIADSIPGSATLSDAAKREIVARTDGVPLFVEELTQALIDLAARPPRTGEGRGGGDTAHDIPATLNDSLMARLDRLPEAKAVAQIAACIGRRFDYRLLAGVAGSSAQDLRTALDRLSDAELIFRRGMPPDSTYIFKHALVRDAAANSLLRSDFRRINAAIADALEAGHPRASAELIAYHAELAGQDLRAVEQLLRAGRDAAGRYANREAIGRLERALRLIDGLPDTPQRTDLELQALATIGVPRIALFGYAAGLVEATYRRTVELTERAGDRRKLFQALRGLWNCIYDRADIEAAHKIAERLCQLAEDGLSPIERALAYRALGGTYFSSGQLRQAIDAWEICVAACAGLPLDSGLAEHGESPRIIGGAYLGFALSMAGDFQRGRDLAEQAVRDAHQLAHPLTFAFAHHLAANRHYHCGDVEACHRLSRESERIAAEHRLVFWIAVGDVLGGWASARIDRDPAGVERAQRGLQAWQASGAGLHVPTWLAVIADAQLAVGANREALASLETAIACAEQRAESFALSTAWRLRGLATARLGNAPGAESCFVRALDLARAQGVLLDAVQAAGELAALLAARGETAAAHQLLAPLLAGLRDDAGIPALSRARAVLAGLQRQLP